MSNAEFFAKKLADEIPAFTRVIRALPGDRLDYKPHEKNTGAGALAFQLADEMNGLVELFENGRTTYEPRESPSSIDDIAAAFEKNAERAVTAAKSVTEERWNGPAKFYVGEHLAWEDTVAEMTWGFLLDMIHHRGQLTAYLRPMGGKVPKVYGPSADDQS